MKKTDLSSFIPPDKSSLIRQALFSILTEEKVEIPFRKDFPEDILSAFSALEKFSKNIEITGERAVIKGPAVKPESKVYCGNSGTVMHVLMGICSFAGWDVQFYGDKSLMNRDHGAFFRAARLYEHGGFTRTSLEKESAQLKSFHMLAMLKNGGELLYKWSTRTSTEALLKKMGADITDDGNIISIKPVKDLHGYSEVAQKDPSSSFIAVCAGLIMDREVEIRGILDEQLRLVPFEVLRKAGYSIKIMENNREMAVETERKTTSGKSIEIKGKDVVQVIDEIPFLAYMTVRNGLKFSVENAEWLRNKESDRIDATVKLLSNFFKVSEKKTGFSVFPEKNYMKSGIVHHDDHRMEMLSALISMDKTLDFEPEECFKVSFPKFKEMINFLMR